MTGLLERDHQIEGFHAKPLSGGSLIQIAQVETIDEAGSMADLAATQWTLESPEDYDHGGNETF